MTTPSHVAPPSISRRTFLRASAGGAIVAVLAGCAPVLRLPPTPGAVAPTTQPRVLRINMPLNRGDVGAAADPGCSGAYHSYFVNSLMFSALVVLDEHLQPTPDLATSWQASPDGAIWRFSLRPDVH